MTVEGHDGDYVWSRGLDAIAVRGRGGNSGDRGLEFGLEGVSCVSWSRTCTMRQNGGERLGIQQWERRVSYDHLRARAHAMTYKVSTLPCLTMGILSSWPHHAVVLANPPWETAQDGQPAACGDEFRWHARLETESAKRLPETSMA